MGAYMGLAVPLAGAYNRANEVGTQVMTVCKDGYTTVTLAQDTAYMTTSPGGVEGIRYRLNVEADTTGSSCAAFWLDHDSGTCSGQLYAAEFWVTGATDTSVGSGQMACIHLVNYMSAGYGMTSLNSGYIKFGEYGGTVMPNLFHMSGFTADASGGCFKTATNSAIDHALKIAIGSTNYYIGLYDAVTGSS